jgi:hypothetical protein
MTLAQTASEDPTFHLWRIARVWLTDTVHAFGAPPAIARELARHVRRALTRRVKALEILLMKLLLVQAADLSAVTRTHAQQAAKSCAPSRRACVSPQEHARAAPHAHNPDQSETWRVRFILRIPPEPRVQTRAIDGPRVRRLGPPLLVREAFAARAQHALHVRMAALSAARFNPSAIRERAKAEKLARRFEALIRAMADPAPYARRLKRKLALLAHQAYDAATRIACRRPPPSRLYDAAVDRRATYESGARIPKAIADSS